MSENWELSPDEEEGTGPGGAYAPAQGKQRGLAITLVLAFLVGIIILSEAAEALV